MPINQKRSQLIKTMSTTDLTTFRNLLGSTIVGHAYQVDQVTSFKTPIRKIITITLSATAARLYIESGIELRDRAGTETKTP